MQGIVEFPPRFGSGPVKTAPRRFDVGTTISGFEVVDFDGRSVTDATDHGDAAGIVETLNNAAAGGPAALTRAIQAL